VPHGVVFIEGVYTLRRELRGLYDLSLFLDCPAATRRERVAQRGENSHLLDQPLDEGTRDEWCTFRHSRENGLNKPCASRFERAASACSLGLLTPGSASTLLPGGVDCGTRRG
jgi:hypothetical protein